MNKLPMLLKAVESISVPIEGTVTFYITGTQGDEKRNRQFTITLSKDEACAFVGNPNFYDLWEHFGVEGHVFEEDPEQYIEVTNIVVRS